MRKPCTRNFQAGSLIRLSAWNRGFLWSLLPGAWFFLLLLGSGIPLQAQDTVTVPKSRLEELERKERELERLKQESATPQTRSPSANQNATPASGNVPSETPPAPVPVRPSPLLASLPPLQAGDIVESLDLANHYRADAPAADRRYRGQRLSVRGEIVGFEKPLLRRNYRIFLPGPDRDTKVICDIYPQDKFSAVITINHGSQLVGLVGETRIPIAKVGDKVVVTGRCQGLRESAVMLVGAELRVSP
jgi:hypothetical protein